MSVASFNVFGALADCAVSHTEKAGRRGVQAEDERRIVADVAAKLALAADDDLLEIGCGTGTLLIPLCFQVHRAVGVDHPRVIGQLRQRFLDPGLETIAANFLEAEVEGDFSKILIYSVIHYLSDVDEVLAFLDRATAFLRPGGRMLVGDLPNEDRRRRFGKSERGKRFNAEWMARCAEAPAAEQVETLFGAIGADQRRVVVDDRLVLRLLDHFRARGYEAFVLPQPADLPFGRTREDLLVCRN